MSYYFREKPKLSDKLRGKSGGELLQELKRSFDEDIGFEPTSRATRDPFERHGSFTRGFPFDDQGFGRLGDIRSHLDDLATRHPEFADQLLGPPWGDVPFHGSLNRHRRRGSSNSHQSHPDEDARSQASGSSAASAASGASGVSSHGEPDPVIYQQEVPRKIPQYGLRNTVDIGQHRHNMENPEKESRGQRSMSAPPENRQQDEPHHQSQNQSPRFISRVDITPQFGNQATDEKVQPPQQKPQQSNVRHIPIFVEGRDEPVVPKNVEAEPAFTRQQSPSQYYQPPPFEPPQEFHSPPHFQRPSHFTSPHFGGRQRDWSHFQDPFDDAAFLDPFHPPRKTQQPRTKSSPFKPQPSEGPRGHDERDYAPNPPQPQPQQTHQQPQQTHQQPEAPQPTKQKPVVPKNPLERVAIVQKEVDSLTEQVKLFTGNSRKDKQYIYLDEMLTRELIKLDDIETEGKENVRQARKNAIKSIQDSISLLESKAPLPKQSEEKETTMDVPSPEGETTTEEKVEVDEANAKVSEDSQPAIPLPASPTKDPEDTSVAESAQGSIPSADPVADNQSQSVDAEVQEPSSTNEVPTAMDIQQVPEVSNPVENSQMSVNPQENSQETNEAEKSKEKKSPKKLKKGKKQPPVSTEPIPLPASENQALN